MLNEPNPRISEVLNELLGPVGRAIIDDHEFDVVDRLTEHALDGPAEKLQGAAGVLSGEDSLIDLDPADRSRFSPVATEIVEPGSERVARSVGAGS